MAHRRNPHEGIARAALQALPDLSPDMVVLAVCLCLLSAALVLTPVGPAAAYLSLGPLPVPGMCIFKDLTGIPCPGCGLARSTVAAIHGELGASVAFHRLGIPTLVYIFLQLLFRLGRVAFPRGTAPIAGGERWLNRGLIVLGCCFMLNWLVTLLQLRL
jgi:hypothetical protein